MHFIAVRKMDPTEYLSRFKFQNALLVIIFLELRHVQPILAGEILFEIVCSFRPTAQNGGV